MVVRVKCEGEWNSIIIPSETFVVLTADQFVGHDDSLLEQQKQDSHVCPRNGTFPLILRKRFLLSYGKDSQHALQIFRDFNFLGEDKLIFTIAKNAYCSRTFTCRWKGLL